MLLVSTTLLFAVYTQNAWEDWYITFRASKNLALGEGFVFSPGQRVHTFTSPIGALIPAGLSALTGNASDALVLWLYRILAALFIGATGVLLLRIARAAACGVAATLFLILGFGFDVKTTAYSINGMETAFLVFFLALSCRALMNTMDTRSRYGTIALGATWAALMWTRPDAFIYAGSLALAFLLFPSAEASAPTRRELFGTYLRAAALGLLLYLPWVIWAWWYYGNPIPNTIIAKQIRYDSLSALLGHEYYVVRSLSPFRTFLPPYLELGGWPDNILKLLYVLPMAGAGAWLIPGLSRLTRAFSLAFLLVLSYGFFVVPYPFPWYLPPIALLGLITQAALINDVLRRLGARRPTDRPRLALAASAVFLIPVAAQFALWLCVGFELRNQQEIIENGHRRLIGSWLKENARTPGDTVFVESLGYIGYFSGLKMYDYPGLSSPEVVRARRDVPPQQSQFPAVFGPLIAALKPDWVVLRPGEVAKVRELYPRMLDESYTQAKVFDVCDKVDAVGWLPGRGFLKFDCRYTVYRRT